jgi:hypothetical protein
VVVAAGDHSNQSGVIQFCDQRLLAFEAAFDGLVTLPVQKFDRDMLLETAMSRFPNGSHPTCAYLAQEDEVTNEIAGPYNCRTSVLAPAPARGWQLSSVCLCIRVACWGLDGWLLFVRPDLGEIQFESSQLTQGRNLLGWQFALGLSPVDALTGGKALGPPQQWFQ